jgi:hypothetical protein
MRKLIILIALPLLLSTGMAQSRSCLRMMRVDEMSRTALWIGRVKVVKVSKANYRGSFDQIAVLQPVDVIEGDSTLTELNVLSRSIVRCAEDSYVNNQELLVFLEPEDSLFHTLNYQYGEFLIVNDVVKGWRDTNNNLMDKPYAAVRDEILAFINLARPQKPQEPLPPQPQPVLQPTSQKPANRPPQPGSH